MNSIKYKTNNAILALLLKQKELEDVKQEVGLVPNGDSYETHAGKFFTTEDVITLRDKVTVGLGSSKFTGIVAKNYDGLNDGLLVFDADGYARVGDEGKLQMIATREDVPLANGIAYYDDHTRKFKTKAESALSVANANKLAGVEATNYARTDTDETFDTKVWIGGQIAASEAKLQVNGFMRTGDIYIHTGGSTPNNDRTNDALHNSIGTLKWRDNTVWTALNSNKSNVEWNASNLFAHGVLTVKGSSSIIGDASFSSKIQLENNKTISGKNAAGTYGNLVFMGPDDYLHLADSTVTEGVKLYSKGNKLRLETLATGTKTFGDSGVTGSLTAQNGVNTDTITALDNKLILNDELRVYKDGAGSTFKNHIGTETFASGFTGWGARLDNDGDTSFEVDNIIVRKLMRVYELEINKIRVAGGNVMVTNGSKGTLERITF